MDIRTVNVETNGLGEVVKVDLPPPSQDYVYNKQVFFKPNNGVRFKIVFKDSKTITGTVSNPSQHVTKADREYSAYGALTSTGAIAEYGRDKIGWMYLGKEYKKTDENTYYADEKKKKIIDYTITGEAD